MAVLPLAGAHDGPDGQASRQGREDEVMPQEMFGEAAVVGAIQPAQGERDETDAECADEAKAAAARVAGGVEGRQSQREHEEVGRGMKACEHEPQEQRRPGQRARQRGAGTAVGRERRRDEQHQERRAFPVVEHRRAPGVVTRLHRQPSPRQRDDQQVEHGCVEQQRERNREHAPSQDRIGRVGVEVVDLPDERDASAVHQAAQQVADDGASFLSLEEEVNSRPLDDRERREHDGQLAFAGEVGPVVADDEEERGAKEQYCKRAEREGEGTGVGAFLWVTVQDAFPLAGIDEAIGVPGGGFLGQPFTETFREGHGGKDKEEGGWGEGGFRG